MTISYTGQNRNAIMSYINSNGPLNGHLRDIHGRTVTTVNFDIVNGELSFRMHGREFDNPTNALIQLHDELAMPTRGATGSKNGTAGNAASDIIGQYRIFPHIHFGNTTLADIVESQHRHWIRSSARNTAFKPVRAKTSKVSSVVMSKQKAREAYQAGKYSYQVIQNIGKKFNFSSKQMSDLLNDLYANEFELMFGKRENNFDLTVYTI